MNERVLELDNPFWSFSLRVYASPGVEAECLRLQDAAGADINLVLYCSWLGAERGLCLRQEDWDDALALSQRWQGAAVRPLRVARKAVKLLPEMAHSEVEAFRRQLAATELQGERIEQALLFALSQRCERDLSRASAESALRQNLALLLSPDEIATGCNALIEAALSRG
jgi:uncharacterized protein (TIGR02444 family)